MAIGLSLPPPAPLAQLSHHQSPPSHTVRNAPCTCGARAFHEDRQRRLNKRVAPMGVAGVMLLRAMEHKQSDKPQEDDDSDHNHDHDAPATRKRSLWRKLLGKGPKCICDKLQKERDAQRPKLLQIPSEYDGCVSVRVAGKRVAYTREMQQLKRRAYTPMDMITECEVEDDF